MTHCLNCRGETGPCTCTWPCGYDWCTGGTNTHRSVDWATLAGMAPLVMAAVLRRAADRYLSEIGKAAATEQHAAAVAATLRRWADEVQP